MSVGDLWLHCLSLSPPPFGHLQGGYRKDQIIRKYSTNDEHPQLQLPEQNWYMLPLRSFSNISLCFVDHLPSQKDAEYRIL